MKKTIRIKNLDCANCALELADELKEIEGVQDAFADFINQRVTVTYEGEQTLEKCVYAISHFEEVEIVDGTAPQKKESRLKEILSIAISALFFIPALVLKLCGIFWAWPFALFLCSFAAAGWQVAWNVILNVPKTFKGGFHISGLFDENLLMTVAAIGAFAIGEYMEGAAVMLLYQIGELLQSIAVGSSRGAIARLMSLQSDVAIRVGENGNEEIAPEELCVGDIILIRRGDKVPADCKIVEGETSLDTKALTGEAYLREVGVGSEVLSGCVNEGSAVKAEVLRLSTESAVAKILDMVENSSEKKAKPEKFITKFARIYTPVVVLCALVIAVIPPLFLEFNFAPWISRALNFLVISCPCALIISVPLTYFSGVGTLARCGVLAKGAVGLDTLSKVKVAAFDKTGTLTEGKFSVVEVKGGEHVLNVAASAEKTSSHPLAQAFKGMGTLTVQSSEEIAGMGIAAVVEGKHVLVGSMRLMREHGVEAEEQTSGNLAVYVAEEGKYLGCVLIADALRAEAKEALEQLKKTGVEKIAVLTGDTEARAKESLGGLPVDTLKCRLLPEQKLQEAQNLKKFGVLMYVGDGINDTPVIAASDISFAMGGLGSDAAIEASDFVLATDDLRALPKAVKAAKKTCSIVLQNIVGSIAIKIALMALSLCGFIPLWAAVFGDVGVMLIAVLNSMRMRAKIK